MSATAPQAAQNPAILYQNIDNTVIVVDIPHSLAAAQVLPRLDASSSSYRIPYSTSALEKPYPSTEPQTAAAFLKVTQNIPASELKLQDEYVKLIEGALDEAKGAVTGREWCLKRIVPERPLRDDVAGRGRGRKRKRKIQQRSEDDLESPQIEECVLNVVEAVEAFRTSSVISHHNPSDFPQSFVFEQLAPDERPDIKNSPYTYYVIPPRSAFLLKPVSNKDSMDALVSNIFLCDKPRLPFILLDPPWPNRSAARRSSYATFEPQDLAGLQKLLLEMDLNTYLAEDGHVAVWVTNKSTCREVVVGNGGLFETLGVEVVEEWIWVKVAKSGEPVTELSGLWRKPYEVCIIGRRVTAGQVDPTRSRRKRRVIFGVPDLHSRKPCLKVLVESLLLKPESIAGRIWGLEVFGRCCVAEWITWGDEAVLFNEAGRWSTGAAIEEYAAPP